MKNTFLKISTLVLFSFSLNACDLTNFAKVQAMSVKGTWENNIKNSDGSSIITTLEIKDVKEVNDINNHSYMQQYTYSASLDSKLNGNQSETLKITTNKINISGTIINNNLNITDVESEIESITTDSRFILSKDGNYLTLIPSDTKFKRKK